jgi:hypothetical protein
MRKIIRASVLVLALAIPAFAGNIPNNLTDNIPNGVTSTGNIPNDATSTGYIPNGVVGEIPNNVTGEIPYGITSVSPQASMAEVWISLFFSLIP